MKIFKDEQARVAFEGCAEAHATLSAAAHDIFQCSSNVVRRTCEFIEDQLQTIEEDAHTYLTFEAEQAADSIVETDGEAEDVFQAVERLLWYESVPHFLYEAYEGFYEDEAAHVKFKDAEDRRQFFYEKIRSDTPREQVETYLHWNGIIGWSDNIMTILFDLNKGE